MREQRETSVLCSLTELVHVMRDMLLREIHIIPYFMRMSVSVDSEFLSLLPSCRATLLGLLTLQYFQWSSRVVCFFPSFLLSFLFESFYFPSPGIRVYSLLGVRKERNTAYA